MKRICMTCGKEAEPRWGCNTVHRPPFSWERTWLRIEKPGINYDRVPTIDPGVLKVVSVFRGDQDAIEELGMDTNRRPEEWDS